MTKSPKKALKVGGNRLIGIYSGLLFIALCLFILSISFVVLQGLQTAKADFNAYAHSVHQEVSKTLAINETILDGFAAFLADVGMQDPNRARFYTRTMLQRYPHLYMFQAAQRVESFEVIEFERQLSEQVRQDSKVRKFVFGKGILPVDVSVRADYYPVVFVEPVFMDGYNIIGLDISSIEFIQKAMGQALATGLTTISQILELSDGSESFVMIKPSVLPGQTIPDQYALLIVKTDVLLDGVMPEQEGFDVIIQYANESPLVNVSTASLSPTESMVFPKLTTKKAISVGKEKVTIRISKQLGIKQVNLAIIYSIIIATMVILAGVYIYMKTHFEAERLKKKLDQKLYQLANYDQLTGLANRHYFEDYFTRNLHRKNRQGGRLALLYIDLNDFKEVNDTLGHQIGDELLKEAATIISDVIRGDDMASRFGGDEFVVLLDQINNEDDVKRVIKRMMEAFSKVSFIAHHNVTLSASLGYAVYPDHGDTLDRMMKVADENMYKQKRDSKKSNVFKFKKDD